MELKFSELKKYFGIFILAAAVIIVYKTFDNIGVIFSGIGTAIGLLTPFIIGGVIAFVLSTPCQKLELLLKRTKISFLKKHRRGLAILLIYAAVVLIITFIMVIIIPQLVDSIKKFVDQLPQMIQSLGSWVGSFSFLEDTSFDVGKFLSENLLSLEKDGFSPNELCYRCGKTEACKGGRAGREQQGFQPHPFSESGDWMP